MFESLGMEPPLPNISHNITNLVKDAIHPYYPLGAVITGYAANETSVPELLGIFFACCGALCATTYYVSKSVNPRLRRSELATIMWFVCSGAIHLIFEGYYAATFATLGSKQTLLGQMWKEYAFGDSRYLTSNTFVLCMETMTAVCWGPGCLLVAWLTITRNPYRFGIQSVVSVGQIYGDALYYATSFFDHHMMGVTYSRPEAFYFWFYFIFMNAIWVAIPGSKSADSDPHLCLANEIATVLVYQSIMQTAKAVATVERVDGSKKAQ